MTKMREDWIEYCVNGFLTVKRNGEEYIADKDVVDMKVRLSKLYREEIKAKKQIKVPAINDSLKVEIMQQAIILYTEALVNAHVSEQAINVCLNAGMDFLRYYEIASTKMKRKMRAKSEKGNKKE